MNTSTLILAFILSIISFSSINAATGTCVSTISLAERVGSSWNETGLLHQIYDITATNAGTCSIESLFALFVFPASVSVSQAWNYNQTSGQISGFQGILSAGQTLYSSGFVLAGNGAFLPSLGYHLATCSSSCSGSATAAPTVPATAAPTTPAHTTPAPVHTTPAPVHTTPAPVHTTPAPATHAPTPSAHVPTTPAPACTTSILITARADASFLLNNVEAQIYDMVINNTGLATVSQLIITISTSASTIVVQSNMWNLVYLSGNQYSVLSYGGLTSGATYHGAGFVLAGASAPTETPAVAIYSTVC